jgi:hypothetical protein
MRNDSIELSDLDLEAVSAGADFVNKLGQALPLVLPIFFPRKAAAARAARAAKLAK